MRKIFRVYKVECKNLINANNPIKSSLLRALVKCFGWEVFFLIIALLFQDCGIK